MNFHERVLCGISGPGFEINIPFIFFTLLKHYMWFQFTWTVIKLLAILCLSRCTNIAVIWRLATCETSSRTRLLACAARRWTRTPWFPRTPIYVGEITKIIWTHTIWLFASKKYIYNMTICFKLKYHTIWLFASNKLCYRSWFVCILVLLLLLVLLLFYGCLLPCLL